MTHTHCPYCSLQCGMVLTGRRTLEVQAWPEFPVNEGALCRKGWTATGLRGHRERLTTPLVRDRETGELTAVSWDEALDRVASRIAGLQAEHGPDSVAVFGGGGLTNEKAYLLGKLARVALGTSQIDYNGRWCMSSAASASNQAFGIDRGLPFPLADLEHTDVLVLVGSNLAETMPPAARHLDRLRERGGKVVVIEWPPACSSSVRSRSCCRSRSGRSPTCSGGGTSPGGGPRTARRAPSWSPKPRRPEQRRSRRPRRVPGVASSAGPSAGPGAAAEPASSAVSELAAGAALERAPSAGSEPGHGTVTERP